MTGAVVEVGVASGGTAVWSHKYLRQGGDGRQYICIDTFSGFLPDQFMEDVKLGNSWDKADQFSASPMALVRQVLNMHGAADVLLLKGDISAIKVDQLPGSLSAILLDVDLAVPIYDGLKLMWPILQPGGIAAVDDCTTHSGDWQAIKGLQKFCAEIGIEPTFAYGMGVVQKPA